MAANWNGASAASTTSSVPDPAGGQRQGGATRSSAADGPAAAVPRVAPPDDGDDLLGRDDLRPQPERGRRALGEADLGLARADGLGDARACRPRRARCARPRGRRRSIHRAGSGRRRGGWWRSISRRWSSTTISARSTRADRGGDDVGARRRQPQAGGGRAGPGRAAIEQLHAELTFQLLQLGRRRRLGEAVAHGGLGHAAELDDVEEQAHRRRRRAHRRSVWKPSARSYDLRVIGRVLDQRRRRGWVEG